MASSSRLALRSLHKSLKSVSIRDFSVTSHHLAISSTCSAKHYKKGAIFKENGCKHSLRLLSTSATKWRHDSYHDDSNHAAFLKQIGAHLESVDLSGDDLDFIKQTGLVLNDADEEALLNLKLNEMNKLQQESENLLIRLCYADDAIPVTFDDNDQNFWLRLCMGMSDNTIQPEVFRYNHLNTFYGIYYANFDRGEELAEPQQPIPLDIQDKSNDLWQHLCSNQDIEDATVKPQVFSYDDTRRKAGIFYQSDSSLSEIINQIMKEENTGMIYYSDADDSNDNFTPFTAGNSD